MDERAFRINLRRDWKRENLKRRQRGVKRLRKRSVAGQLRDAMDERSCPPTDIEIASDARMIFASRIRVVFPDPFVF